MEKKRTLYSLESDIRRILEDNDFVSTCDERGKQWYINLVSDLAIYIQQELDKAREDGRREQQRLDCELYGTAVATNEEIEEKWNLSKLKNNDNMEVKEKMSEDFIRGYNEAIRDILAKRGMWAGADKKLLQELSNYLKEEK